MKKYLSFILIMFLLLIPTFVVADELEIVGTAVRVRNTPSTNGIKLAEVNSGKRYPLKSATKVADIEGCKEGWYNVLIDGQDGYVCSRYARIIPYASVSSVVKSIILLKSVQKSNNAWRFFSLFWLFEAPYSISAIEIDDKNNSLLSEERILFVRLGNLFFIKNIQIFVSKRYIRILPFFQVLVVFYHQT